MNNNTKKIEISYMNHRKYKFQFKNEFEKILTNLKTFFSIDKPVMVDVCFVNNDQMRKLNWKHRGKDYPTDILSFGFEDSLINEQLPFLHLGELVISVDKVKEQALEFNHSEKREYCYLFTHGLVHLMGYDHELENERIHMNNMVEEIFSPLNITREDK
ncbi:rRNA maturation RNase YbeY [Mycoplasmopsis alligatoris]|uniref:Endoribonuclease YbeY n=1 Tax=Mycoplasmopsis alligatoris A21JP2 TaxID=747682 RepID=D4XVK7_9BACT|nr:rRNA maturation RNase YbeY [Mycoplasmopsis alligatoris]EFF41652.1 metalloprotein, YbeY family [Mycoplasmopsis alligatoris A21JP2]